MSTAELCDDCARVHPDTCPVHTPVVSDAPDTLDSLVSAASIPNLAALFRKAKAAGVLAAAHEYGGNK